VRPQYLDGIAMFLFLSWGPVCWGRVGFVWFFWKMARDGFFEFSRGESFFFSPHECQVERNGFLSVNLMWVLVRFFHHVRGHRRGFPPIWRRLWPYVSDFVVGCALSW